MLSENIDKRVSFVKLREVESPKRANLNDAGTDIYIPKYSEDYFNYVKEKNDSSHNKLNYMLYEDKDGETVFDIIIPSGESVMVPMGIKVWIYDKDTFLQATDKSGIASQRHLKIMANAIDADYQGEVIVNMQNVGNVEAVITSGMKLTQLIHREYIKTEWIEMSNDEYDAIGVTDRGDGGFGHTGV